MNRKEEKPTEPRFLAPPTRCCSAATVINSHGASPGERRGLLLLDCSTAWSFLYLHILSFQLVATCLQLGRTWLQKRRLEGHGHSAAEPLRELEEWHACTCSLQL